MSGWKIRPNDADDYDLVALYAGKPTMLTLNFHHGGRVRVVDGRSFYAGKNTYVDFVDCKTFSLLELNPIMRQLGYDEASIKSFEFTRPYCALDLGGIAIRNDEDVTRMCRYTQGECKVIDVIVEHNERKAPMTKATAARTSVSGSPVGIKQTARKGVGPINKQVARTLLLDEHLESESEEEEVEEQQAENHSVANNDSEGDDEELVDKDNVVQEVEVDMTDYRLNLDVQMGNYQMLNSQVIEGDDNEVEVIDNDWFESASDSAEDEVDRNNSRRLRKFRKEQQAQINRGDHAPFYVTQVFGDSTEVKDLIRRYAVESRRCIKIILNDQRRVRAVCVGVVQEFGPNDQPVGPKGEAIGPNDQPVGPADKGKGPSTDHCVKDNPKSSTCIESSSGDHQCPWALHCSKLPGQKTWMVKTFKGAHTCLQSREIKHCTSKYMSQQIREQINRNPGIPTKALQEELEQKLQISISWMKAFRAKQQAATDNKGDYHAQYSLLRSYCEELMLQNPGTTVKIDVEHAANPNATTRQFKRIYICIGALKEGFKACMRDLIGLDGAFMKGPYPGQVLTAVGLDSNNGIYPVAYAVVEAETRDSWTWFLECLGPDLDLERNSNFTFITDRQKGLIQAISNVFPSAEHRYCFKHIHENMKQQWRGRYYKDILWRTAVATTKVQFEATMKQMKRLNVDAYNWLTKIDPKHWTRSHFTGRCKSDMLLNNLCESLNKQLVPARDKPIIACVDFIREYLMKRIVVVQRAIDRAKGPLTPAAMDLMSVIMKEANDCRVVWNGGVKFQVTAPWGDQSVVDIEHMTCTCRKWEISGLPCKHAVATNWDMRRHQMRTGIPETWAHRCYWLETWKNAYTYKINPVTGTSTWPESTCPIGLTPPVHHNPVGRPRKKRRRGLYEDEPLVVEGKLNKKINFGKCKKCGNRGHNSRTCKGQGGESQGVGSQGVGTEAGESSHAMGNQAGGSSQAGGTEFVESQAGGSPFVASQAVPSQGGGSQGGGSQGMPRQGGGSQAMGSQTDCSLGGGSLPTQASGSQGGGSLARGSQGVGGQGGGRTKVVGKKLVKKVRGKSQRILRHRLAKITPGPGLSKDDAMVVD